MSIYRSGLLYKFLNMAGQGDFITKCPPPPIMLSPSSSTTSTFIEGNGLNTEPGFRSEMGNGVIICIPVSVCHQVSMIGHLSLPICLWYHTQASGLIGSPTLPKSLKEVKSYFLGHFSPYFMNILIVVGAV